MIKASGVILAGGKSKRMGKKDKALIKINNKTFLDIMLGKIDDFSEKIIVGRNKKPYIFENAKFVSDIFENKGPLGGIYTGIIKSSYKKSIILPCDMPFVEKELLKYMLHKCENYDAVIPRHQSHFQPLCACYSKKCIEKFEKAILKGITKPIDVFSNLNIYYLKKEEVSKFGNYDMIFMNINTIKQYKEIL